MDSSDGIHSCGRISVSVVYKRLSLFYVENLILPNALLLALSSLTFFIPGDNGEKISFGVTVTLALCVNLTLVTSFVPQTSTTFPRICTYFFLSIVLFSLAYRYYWRHFRSTLIAEKSLMRLTQLVLPAQV